MNTYLLNKAGGVENLIASEIPVPKVSDNEVLIRVHALSINPADVKVKYSEQGLTMICGQERPLILGWDVAGVVEEAGESASEFQVGDRVFGMVNFPGHGQAYSEYVAAPQEHLAKIPDNTDFNAAAASTLAALTALQVLRGRVHEADKVLVHAGSGGVGHFAIQIAKSFGAHVTTTCSLKNREFVLGLGADVHIDYRSEKFEYLLSDLDFVFDTQGVDTATASLKVLKHGGQLVSIAMTDELPELQKQAERLGIEAQSALVQSSGKDMHQIAKLLAEGKLKPEIYKTFPFAEMHAAHAEVELGRSVGKVIVTL